MLYLDPRFGARRTRDDYMREIFIVNWPRWMPKRRVLVLPGGEELEVYVGQRISDTW